MVGNLDEALQTGIEQKGIEVDTSKKAVKKKRKIKKLPKIKDIKLVSIDIGSRLLKSLRLRRRRVLFMFHQL